MDTKSKLNAAYTEIDAAKDAYYRAKFLESVFDHELDILDSQQESQRESSFDVAYYVFQKRLNEASFARRKAKRIYAEIARNAAMTGLLNVSELLEAKGQPDA